MRPRLASLRSHVLILVVLLHVLGPCRGPLQADTFTWNGLGGSNDWNDKLNWNFLQPPPPEPPFFNAFSDVIISGSKSSSVIDVDFIVTDLVFNSGVPGMTFTGAQLALRVGSITNNDGSEQNFDNDKIVLDLHGVAGGFDVGINAASGNLDFNAPIVAEQGITVNVSGSHDVFFDGGFTRKGFATTDIVVNKSGSGELRLRKDSRGIDQLSISGTGKVLLSRQAGQQPTLNANMNVNVSASALFDLNTNNADIDKLEGSGAVELDGGTLTLGDSSSFTWGGNIRNGSATGGIIKDKSATMTITASQSYTGNTSITAGTLRLSNSGRLSDSTDVSVASGATFDLNGVSDTVDSISGGGTVRLGGGTLTVDESSNTRTLSGSILESGTLRKNGAGTLVLTNSGNSFTLLDINAGTVRVSNAGALGTGTLEISAGTLQNTAAMTNSLPTTINSSASTLNINNAATFTQASVISGSGTLNKAGNGTLELGANNTYSGDTNILDGLVRLRASNRIPNGSDLSLVTGAALQLGGFSETVRSLSGSGGSVATSGGRLTVNASSGKLTYGGGMTGSGGLNKQGGHTLILTGSLTNSGATNITGGVLVLKDSGRLGNNSDIAINSAIWDLNGVDDLVDSISGDGTIRLGGGTLSVDEDSSNTRTFSGSIDEAGSLTKAGTHTLVLSGDNSFDGVLSINEGILLVSSSNNLGKKSVLINFGGPGTLAATAKLTNPRQIQLTSGVAGTLDIAASQTWIQDAAIFGTGNTTLVKEGRGTLALAAPSATSFSGNVTVNNGTLEIAAGSGNALGNATRIRLTSPGQLLVTEGEDVGSVSGSGNLVLNASLGVGFDNASTTISGDISGKLNGGQFGKRGTGTLTLSGTNTYSVS